MSGPSWELFVADRTGVRQAQVDTYSSAEVVARVNDVSTWRLDVPTDTEAGALLIADSFARLEVSFAGSVWRSGPVTHLQRTVDLDGDNLEVSGVDDDVWLARRNAHPQPGTAAPPYSTTAYDVHTGVLSTVLAELVNVNAGPGATLDRRVPGLVATPPAPVGPNVSVSARWQNLLTLMQDTAAPSGLIFEVVDLTFRARMPVDRGALFSFGLETLAAWSMVSQAPDANYVVVAGGGVGTARIIRETPSASSIAQWGRCETFDDRRDTTDTTELDKAAAEALAKAAEPVSVTFTPLDTDGQQFGRDWTLGDIVTVRAGGVTVVDQVREVHVTLDDNGATIVPTVGKPTGDLALFREMAGLDRRVRQLERV